MSSRGEWGSQLQFLLTCVGYAVGLGNLWRFPSVAYENGGGAFLIPYLICSLCFGLPCLYLEFFVGQFTQSGASKAFRQYLPLLQGIGWVSTVCAFMVGIYYNVIIVYCVLYLWDVVTLQSHKWTRCDNSWNTPGCIQINSANSSQNLTTGILAADDYYKESMLKTSSGIGVFGSINWPVFIGLVLVWSLTALCLVRGVKWIGRISYVTATLPYLIIGVLFVRGVTLPGAGAGLKYYLTPQFDKLIESKTWVAAANQLCFSLSIGFGGLLTLSSYNDRKHNCFKDAVIVVFCDSFMSVFGGCAVFSVLGHLSLKTNTEISDLVSSKSGIAFVAYPEAIAMLPGAPVWAFLLFFMFFLLGISSQFGLARMFIPFFPSDEAAVFSL